VVALVHGSGSERIATHACSDATLRRRRKAWAPLGIAEQLHALALAAYDRTIGLELGDASTDGAITKAPSGGDKAGPSPVDRAEGGLKRSMATDAGGVPLGLVAAGADRGDQPLLAPPVEAMKEQVGPLPQEVTAHLDRAYDKRPVPCWPSSASWARSPVRASRPRSSSASAGWWSARTHG
jgi:hypothetical protein